MKMTNTGYDRCFVAYFCEGCSAVPLTKYKSNRIKQELTKEKYYFGDNSDERLSIDMRRSKGYTIELEKFAHDDGGVTLTIKLKQAAAKKNEAENYCIFTGWILVY